MKNFGIKTTVILATLLVFTLGIFLGSPGDWGTSWKAIRQNGLVAGIRNSIHLGLDLQGGTHLILQVMVEEAVGAETDRTLARLQQEMRSKNIGFTAATKTEQVDRIVIRGLSADNASALSTLVDTDYPDYTFTTEGEGTYVLTMKPSAVQQLKTTAVTRSIETIRSRVDALGVTEPVIQEHGLGENQILVQLPGVDDPIRVRRIMQETGMLEIRLVKGGPYATEQEAVQNNPGGTGVVVPDGTAERRGFYVLDRAAIVSGEDIRSATPSRSEFGQQLVQFTLKAAAGNRFATFTEQNIGNPLSVVLNNRVRSVATIRDRIADSGQIEGLSAQEATDLSKILESGALPASIRYLEERQVGASLGADSVRQGLVTAAVGLTAVILFLLFYYRGSGINAALGLLLNLVILLGFLGYSGATLTLPGIAGVILTIGMGVDSNVLIFERIKEELRAGKTVAQSVHQGFDRAWVTIIDTHVTTIVSAAILFMFGTGPIRGFAITLVFGLAANVFTAVFVSRQIFEFVLSRKQRGEALSI
jgi:preprotein translocase subunit SecD